MGQDFHVVRCVTCQIFQVQQVKKVNRWSCRVCGEKQSLLKEYGRGSGPDCRRHVQKLNARRGAVMEEHARDIREQEEAGGEEKFQPDSQVKQTQISRWVKYLGAPKEAEPEKEQEAELLMDRLQVPSNNMTDRKRRRTDSPEQCCSVMRKPTVTSLRHSSLNPDPGSRSVPALSSDCQVQKRELPVSCSRQTGMDSFFCDDIIASAKPLLPASLFEMDEEFNFDELSFLNQAV